MLSMIKNTYQSLRENGSVPGELFARAQNLYLNEACLLLTQARTQCAFLVTDEEGIEKEISLIWEEDLMHPQVGNKIVDWDLYSLTALYELMEKASQVEAATSLPGRRYTRAGMMRRVLGERQQRALEAEYQIEWADNIYGEHILVNEKGVEYRLTLRDFEKEIGYVDSADLRTNKLGTTKHLIYAFQALKRDPVLYNSLDKTYPFVEIYLNPINQYKITWHYPHDLDSETQKLIKKYFGNAHVFPEEKILDFLGFIQEASMEENIVIRPEVRQKVEAAYDEEMRKEMRRSFRPDYSVIKADLFSYQKEGVEFALFKKGAIIADEMGLGKNLTSYYHCPI